MHKNAHPPKKTVVIDLEYMRPTPEVKSRGSRRKNDENYDSNESSDIESDTASNNDTVSDTDSDSNRQMDTKYSLKSAERSAAPTNEIIRRNDIKDSDYAVDSDEDLLQSVLDEPTFPLDVNAILSAMSKNENTTIANMTLQKIAARRNEILSNLDLEPVKYEEFSRKLQLYRVIETPQELRHGQLVRWIPLKSLPKPYLTLGGTIFGIKQNLEDGLHQVTIRNVKGFVFQIRFEVNVVFQRLSREELLILRAVEYVSDVNI
jgi:hypothetical protein